jgi:lipid-binding SYLF domain-containing protein
MGTITSRSRRPMILAVAMLIAVTEVSAPRAAGETDEAARAKAAGAVLHEMTRAEDARIPNYLLERAKAIAVVPHVVRGAFIVGGRWGKGVVASRDAQGEWDRAAFVELGGASVGFQIGGDATDLIMVFIEEDGLDALLNDRVELGANVSVAAGPLGRSAEAGTNVTLDAAIYAYSRSKGVFAGAALDGSVVSIDDDANTRAFGHEINVKTVMKSDAPAPAVFQPFLNAVRAVTPPVAH